MEKHIAQGNKVHKQMIQVYRLRTCSTEIRGDGYIRYGYSNIGFEMNGWNIEVWNRDIQDSDMKDMNIQNRETLNMDIQNMDIQNNDIYGAHSTDTEKRSQRRRVHRTWIQTLGMYSKKTQIVWR